MFTLPPRPPKDYELKNVTNNQASAPEFTPSALPRATQTTLGKFCSPIPASDDESADKSSIEELNDRILDRMAKQTKAWWIDKPEANAYFLHDVFKKYSVMVDPDYDPRYKNRPRIFQRSYKYELDCIEDSRLRKLWEKTRREEEKANRKQEKRTAKEKEKEKPLIALVLCKLVPPFWWKEPESEDKKQVRPKEISIEPTRTVYQSSYLRWQDEPKLFEKSLTDPCLRRDEVAKIGQPFRHEACTWYFKNYPPPNIKFIPQKFSK